MKVVRIITRLNRGGPLRQLQALVPGLARLGIAGPVWVGEPAAGEEDCSDLLRAAGVDVVKVPGLRRPISPFADRRARRWIRDRLLEERPDVVHTHMGKAGALGRLAARDAGVPVVVHTFHGHHMTAPFPKSLAARLAERRLAKITTAAICLSASQRDDLVDRFSVVPPEKAFVIGPGIDVAALRASAVESKIEKIHEKHSTSGGALFLWLGRFVDVKDPMLAIAAAARLGPPSRLLLAGDGPLWPRAEAEADRLGLGDEARFIGPVSEPGPWIAACDAVLISSRSEGTPIAAVEAACLGRPVVATAVGGVRDVVKDAETGLLVPPGDPSALAVAMERLADNPALRNRLGTRAKSDAESRFGAARLVSRTAALYRSLLARA